MNERLKIEDLQVGDVVYIERFWESGWTRIGNTYKKETIKRITPKKTKAVTEEGTELTKDIFFFREFDEDMQKEDLRTRSILHCYKKRNQIDKAAFVNLDREAAIEVDKLFSQIITICEESKMKVL